METKGLIIEYGGDPSVGIFPATWKLEGELIFEEKSDFDSFKEKLQEAFEYTCDQKVGIYTFEEIEKREKIYNEGIK